ncbi:ATPase, YjeE family [Leptospira johnsonii]|uniref:ATPase, YjeE family n=1 Tax=Leptospira johnsonii TaxID=1917820 RepID=A0A2P2D7N5_9LEPT|nr:ATPase, YjeE family [Leptospira johnsonii]
MRKEIKQCICDNCEKIMNLNHEHYFLNTLNADHWDGFRSSNIEIKYVKDFCSRKCIMEWLDKTI